MATSRSIPVRTSAGFGSQTRNRWNLRRRIAARRTGSRQLVVESLEPRALLSASPAGDEIWELDLSGGALMDAELDPGASSVFTPNLGQWDQAGTLSPTADGLSPSDLNGGIGQPEGSDPQIVTMEWQGREIQAIKDQWIIQLNDFSGTAAEQTALAQEYLGAIGPSFRVLQQLGADGQFLIEAPGDRGDVGPSAGCDAFQGAIDCVYVEPNELASYSLIPNDPYFSSEWGLNNTGQTIGGQVGIVDADVDAPEAWDSSTGSSSVIVAVVDSGVKWDHPDLAANIFVNTADPIDGVDNDGNGFVDDYRGWDFVGSNINAPVPDNNPMDEYGHGTHVAGTIGAVGNNGLGVTGVAQHVKLLPLKIGGSSNSVSVAAATSALNYIAMMRDRGFNIRVSNHSWGGSGFNQALSDAITGQMNRGILLVAAAGNGGADGIGDNNDSLPQYPASYTHSNIISVAATDNRDTRASFSNYGSSSVDLGAPGLYVYSTMMNNGYGYGSGTSMAAPHVTGVAALAAAYAPGASGQDIKNAILSGVDPIPALAGITLTGGRLNAFRTLQQLADFDTRPFPTPLQAKPPAGSLIYDPSVTSRINFPGDIDRYTIDVDAGQTITVFVESEESVKTKVDLLDRSDTLLASATAAQAGEDVLLQVVPTTGAGQYTIVVSGVVDDGTPRTEGITAQTFSDEASFLAAAGPDLALEDFEGFGGVSLQTLDTTTNYGPISPGDIPPGVVFSSTNGYSTDLFIAPAGFGGQPDIATDSLFANYYGTPLVVDFSPGVTAVGSDLISFVASANIVITLRDGDGGISTYNVQPPQDSPAYFGIVATQGEIVRLEYDPPSGITAGVDDFRFGQAAESGTGAYTLQLTLNAALEEEDLGGAANNTPATAQDLDATAVLVRAGEIAGDRLAVLGAIRPATVQLVNGSFETGNFTGWTTATTNTPFVPWTVSRAGSGAGYSMAPTAPQDGLYDAWNGFDGAGPMQFTMYQDVALPAGSSPVLSWKDRVQWNFFASTPQARIYEVRVLDPSTNAQLATLHSFSTPAVPGLGDTGWRAHSASLGAFSGQTIRLQFWENIPQSFAGPGQIEFDAIELTFPGPATSDDLYSFTADPYQVVTLTARNRSAGDVDLQLLAPDGATVLASAEETIGNFRATVGGRYYVRVSGDPDATYSLLVTHDVAFDTEPNDAFASAQDLDGTHGALGALDAGAAGGIVVPANLATSEGNSGNAWPFHVGYFGQPSMRYQQIYSASQFAAGGIIDAIRFRRDVGQSAFSTSGIDIKINLSYAATSVATASPTFASNIGSGVVTVFDGLLSLSSTGSGAPSPFDIVIDVANTFGYDPSRGDLLVDIVMRNSPITQFFDASGFGQQTVTTRIYSYPGNANATTGYVGWDSVPYGLVTQFDFVASSSDWYALPVANPGAALKLATGTPADGPGEFGNTLNPKIELYAPNGTLVASGAVGADGRNEQIQYTATEAGTYRVRVSSEGGTAGEYVLLANRGPTLTLNPVAPISENNLAYLAGTFTDADVGDAHAVTVDWDDPNAVADSTFQLNATSVLSAGNTFASVTDDAVLTVTSVNKSTGAVGFYIAHRYRDDGPAPGNNTPADVSTINVTVRDELGGAVSSSDTITQELIENGDFETGDFTGWSIANSGASGGWAINNGTYDPIGPATPLAPISGDFDAMSYQTGPGTRFLSDAFVVPQQIVSATLSWSDRIRNYAQIFEDPNQEFRVLLHDLTGGWIEEIFSTQPGDPLQQEGPNHRSFDVTALLQSRAGQAIQLSFEQQETYYHQNVTLDDISLLVTTASLASPTVTVNNIAPSVTGMLNGSLPENGTIAIYNSFTDPGQLDAHTLIVDWDDPNSPADSTFALPATNLLTAGSTFTSSTDGAVLTVNAVNVQPGRLDFRIAHQYRDDGLAPGNGTTSDLSTIRLTVSDDDGGSWSGIVGNLTVMNMVPGVSGMWNGSLPENGTIALYNSFTDAGQLDAHALIVDWDDPNNPADSTFALPATNLLTAGSTFTSSTDGAVLTVTAANVQPGRVDFRIAHQYRDDGLAPGNGTTSDPSTIRMTVSDDDGGNWSGIVGNLTVMNMVPGLTGPLLNTTIPENQTISFVTSFTDPGLLDAHTLIVDWDDSNSPADATFALPATGVLTPDSTFVSSTDPSVLTVLGVNTQTGRVDFRLSHQYLDDGLAPGNGTIADASVIRMTVSDDDGGSRSGTIGNVTVVNLIPAPTGPITSGSIPENGTIAVNTSFTDPGLLDEHTLIVDWDDPNSPVDSTFALSGTKSLTPGTTFSSSTDAAQLTIVAVNLQTGRVDFLVAHQYLDDGLAPGNGTAADASVIQLTVSDDDTASRSGTVGYLTVLNLAPVILRDDLALSAGMIDENGSVTLSGSFTDVGTLDTHTVMIDWGDGTSSPAEVAQGAGAGAFTATHQYLDDDPTGTPSDEYAITVTVTDDDTGTASASTTVPVQNVAPVVLSEDLVLSASMIDENDSVTLDGSFTDVGTLDTHAVLIDWGDGTTSPADVTQGAGAGTFTATHQYLDDDPTGTPSDEYTITVTVTDDDTGTASATTTVTVDNVAPVLAGLASTATFDSKANEGQTVAISATFTDVGTLDTHSATIDWGDGSPPEPATVVQGSGTGSVSATHAYANGGVFTVTLTLTDDDTGQDVRATTAVVIGAGIKDGVLQIVGSDAANNVTVNTQGNGWFKVHADFFPEANFRLFDAAQISYIQMWLCNGDDQATIAGNITTSATIYGGAGNDHINGGGGRSILIGGLGADRLVGGSGDDILIAGTTAYDRNDAALLALLQEWNSGDDYPTRVTKLRTGILLADGTVVKLAKGTTVLDDTDKDQLTGSSGLDWFFLDAGLDKAADKKSDEVGN